MDQRRFDGLIRKLTEEPRSRRGSLRLVAGTALGGLLAGAGFGAPAAEAAGCRKVDEPCRQERQCCSGLCRGKRGKKTCRGHGAGTCKQQGQPLICTAPEPVLARCGTDPDSDCACFRTTAGTNYCGEFFALSGCTDCSRPCAECERDADCEALGYPPGSACAPTTTGRCIGLCESGTFCLAPCGTAPRPPELQAAMGAPGQAEERGPAMFADGQVGADRRDGPRGAPRDARP